MKVSAFEAKVEMILQSYKLKKKKFIGDSHMLFIIADQALVLIDDALVEETEFESVFF